MASIIALLIIFSGCLIYQILQLKFVANQDLSVIYEKSPIGVVKFDRQGIITFVSPVAERLFGMSATSLIGHPLFSFGCSQEFWGKLLESPTPLEFRFPNERVFSVSVNRVKNGSYLGVFKDITIRVKAIETLDHANIIIDAVSFAQAQVIEAKNIQNLSPVFEQILQSVQIVSKSSHGLILRVEENNGDQVLAVAASTHPVFFEEMEKTKLGRTIKDQNFAVLYPLIQRAIQEKRAIFGRFSTGPEEESIIKHCYVYPLIYNDCILGILAIGKEKGEYSSEITDYILPLLQASVILIEGLIMELERNEAEKKLKERDIKLTNSLKMLAIKNQELSLARNTAQQASQAKSTFLANMSHEIRTPLNAVIGMADLLRRTELSVKQEKYVEIIASQGEVLLSLINDILDLSKIEAGEMKLELIDMDLPLLIRNVLNVLEHKAQEKNIELIFDYDPNLPTFIVMDPVRIRQVLLNLIGNAVKFTEKGSINIHVKKSGDQGVEFIPLRVEVTDTGIGISAHAQHKLFQNFQQADASVTRKYGGSGLGLAISQKLIKAMGGEIGVISREGKGSTFWFEIFVKPVQLNKSV